MLPKLYRYPLREDENKCMDMLFKRYKNNDDGHTNAKGKTLVIEYKAYLERSYAFIVVLAAFDRLLYHIPEELKNAPELFYWFGEDDVDFTYRRISKIVHNVTHGLFGQRRIAHGVVTACKYNEIDDIWYRFLMNKLRQQNERLSTIRLLLKEELATTPFAIYNKHIERLGVTFDEDVLNYLSDKIDISEVYKDNYKLCNDLIHNYIFCIIKDGLSDDAVLEAAEAESNHYKDVLSKRTEKRRAEKEALTKEIIAARQEDARNVLNSKSATAAFLHHYQSDMGLRQIIERNYGGSFYVVRAVHVSARKEFYGLNTKILYASTRMPLSSNLTWCIKFKTEEGAKEAMKDLQEKRPLYVFDVAHVDLVNTERYSNAIVGTI